ncbi:hypothetical protein NBRC116494_09220 [Aurantivibrio plasticivorans]
MSNLSIHHLGLAVADLEKTTEFFTNVLGFEVVNEVPDYPAKFVSNGNAFITLWQTEQGALEFNRRTRIGLHHFALKVDSQAELNSLFDKASNYPGVTVDFSPEPLGDSGAIHGMIFEPGGIRMELIFAG